MKRLLTMAVFCSLLLVAFYRNAASEGNLVREIAPGVFVRLAEPEKKILANTGWVVFRDYVLVIDANFPWGARAILADLRKTTDKPVRFVFDTHYHGDHAFGNSVWVDAGATILCSRECVAESRAKNPAAWAKGPGTRELSLKSVRLEHRQIGRQHKVVFDAGEHPV